VLAQLKAAPEAKGLSLADLTELTGMDRSALSKLETGQRANPTVETLVRYADAAGKRPAVSLADAQNGGMAVACWDSRTKKAALLEALRLVAPWRRFEHSYLIGRCVDAVVHLLLVGS
jgi:transcriptional regulator with XRE-family HTH domain